jgi:hypothetical protein
MNSSLAEHTTLAIQAANKACQVTFLSKYPESIALHFFPFGAQAQVTF